MSDWFCLVYAETGVPVHGSIRSVEADVWDCLIPSGVRSSLSSREIARRIDHYKASGEFRLARVEITPVEIDAHQASVEAAAEAAAESAAEAAAESVAGDDVRPSAIDRASVRTFLVGCNAKGWRLCYYSESAKGYEPIPDEQDAIDDAVTTVVAKPTSGDLGSGEYPECEKLAAVSDKSQAIGEFVEEFLRDKGIRLCVFEKNVPVTTYGVLSGKPKENDGEAYVPIMTPTNGLLAEFFDIDMEKVEQERREMLRRCQAEGRGKRPKA